MQKLITAFGLLISSFSSNAMADYINIQTCDELVSFFNGSISSSYVSITNDIDCTSSPTLEHGLRESINGNGHTISNLRFKGDSSSRYKTFISANLTDIVFDNATVHNTEEWALFSIKARWNNVKFNNLSSTGKPFKMLFWTNINGFELSDVLLDIAGVKLEEVKTLVFDKIFHARVTNFTLENATLTRKSDWMTALISERSEDSYLTNIKLYNISILGQPTGNNGRLDLALGDVRNTHVNGLNLDNISFSRSKEDSFFSYEYDDKSTYVNIYHNLFDDNKQAGNIPISKSPRDNINSRVINFQSMNQPKLPPAICSPYLLQDSYFGIKSINN
ncbi:pectate lyase-like adhesive domain-containing protein [Veronia pacifica]|uniref:Right handed beta helix domain-containing protein n=1 Tax=Veronia pacifica TaxID=1080227 RepID=A0A1C3EE50_9GAMM|nr:pectate lyase-like adhesive domain-containing protein [Veronia pacifica]ODA31532.1 hypothetical protein A8L45_16675 [Veronia pacifica]